MSTSSSSSEFIHRDIYVSGAITPDLRGLYIWNGSTWVNSSTGAFFNFIGSPIYTWYLQFGSGPTSNIWNNTNISTYHVDGTYVPYLNATGNAVVNYATPSEKSTSSSSNSSSSNSSSSNSSSSKSSNSSSSKSSNSSSSKSSNSSSSSTQIRSSSSSSSSSNSSSSKSSNSSSSSSNSSSSSSTSLVFVQDDDT